MIKGFYIFCAVFGYCIPATSQSYSAYWSTNSEIGVVNYQLLQSADSINWITLATVLPLKADSNKYSYVLPLPKNFYRVRATMLQGSPYYTNSKYFSGTTVSSATYSRVVYYDKLAFTTINENKTVSYYLIEKTTDSVNYSTITKITAKL